MRLTHAVTAEKPDAAISDRRRFLQGRLSDRAWLFTLDNGKKGSAPDYVQVGGRFNDTGKAVYDLGIRFTAETWADTERVFAAVGDSAEAHFAHVMPPTSARLLISYYGVVAGRRPFTGRSDDLQAAQDLTAALSRVGKRLPEFKAPLTDLTYLRPDDPVQPRQLGWINYWSERTCRYLAFPDQARDRDLLAHSYRTPAGAWIVKLCAEPLDLSRDDHVTLLADTYSRFPKLLLSTRRQGLASS